MHNCAPALSNDLKHIYVLLDLELCMQVVQRDCIRLYDMVSIAVVEYWRMPNVTAAQPQL